MTTITQWILRVLGAATLAGTAIIHLHLYRTGYKFIPKVGHLFLALVIAAFIATLAVLIVPKAVLGLTALGGALLQASTVVGLILFTNVRIFGFKEMTSSPHYGQSIVVETVGFLILGALAASSFRHQSPDQ